MGRSRISTATIFRNACNRISFYLGGIYTDNGFLEEMKKNYKLSDAEMRLIINRMNSKYRHVLGGTSYDRGK